ncbi:glycosyltransferase family 2 protein [Marmoricola endophyticus]|uniref:glycosyltransferase family 2 protein n=1 Tax=Marmoricola endophyticus TaxID=2040280 RepID=UPI001667B946|nr:glycosyltransferase family 2 protein [Marmoricola endophyticus]
MTERTGAVVLNFGPPDDTLACLDSLERSEDLDLRIVVVDNGPESGDQHHALAEGIAGRAELVATGANLGYAAGNNVGISRLLDAGVDRVWVLNPDTRAEPSTLGQLGAHLDAVPDCAVVAPRFLLPGDPPRIWFESAEVDRGTAAIRPDHLNRTEAECPPGPARDTDYVAGAGMLLRAAALRDVGMLPEDFFLYFEETTWCLSAADLGWRVMVLPEARMLHLKRSGSAVPTAYYVYYMTRNRLLFAERVLGIDRDEVFGPVLETFERDLLVPWRARVAAHAPHWLETFEELVRRALRDARAGVTGGVDGIAAAAS